jgi:hypothetical protein
MKSNFHAVSSEYLVKYSGASENLAIDGIRSLLRSLYGSVAQNSDKEFKYRPNPSKFIIKLYGEVFPKNKYYKIVSITI